MGARAHHLPPVLSLVPGDESSCDLRIQNGGSRVDEFTFHVLGVAAEWTTVTPPRLSLLPGVEGIVRLELHPPRAPSSRSGTIPFGVRIVSAVDPSDTTIEKTDLDIAPFVEVGADISPRKSRGRRRCEHSLTISNLGNVETEASISAEDPDRSIVLAADPPLVAVAPGERAAVSVRAQARHWIFTGSAESRPFTVTVGLSAPGLATPPATAVAEATFLQMPVVPRWALVLGAVVVALLGFISQTDPLSGLGLVLLLVLVIGVLIAVVLALIAFRLVRRRRSGHPR